MNTQISIVAYSEKSFAVFGDTKAFKDQLKAAGGRFNPFLKRGDTKAKGWIFSNNKKADVEKIISAPPVVAEVTPKVEEHLPETKTVTMTTPVISIKKQKVETPKHVAPLMPTWTIPNTTPPAMN